MVRFISPFIARTILAIAVLVMLGGCEYTVQPLKGTEGRTLVYAAVGKGGAPNAGIIVTSNGVVVVDPPLNPELGKRLNFDALRRSKIFWDELHRNKKARMRTQPPPVLYVLNTTYRASHTFGNQAFLPKADFIATEKAGRHLSDRLEGRRMREVLQNEFKVPNLGLHATIEPTITFDGTFTIHSKEVEIKCYSMGDCVGEGDAVVYLPQQKILYTGDLVLTGYVPYPKGRTLTVRNWIKALRRLETLEIDVVVPGHGETGRKGLIKRQREFLETLVLEVRRAIAENKSADEAAKTVRLTNFARWVNYNKWIGGNIRLVYEELKKDPTGKKVSSGPAAGMAAFERIEPPDAFRDK